MADSKTKKTVFETLNSINANEHVEIKKTNKAELKYLSWPWAWAEVKKAYPEANYEVLKFNGLPYAFDPETGYMVYTRVTIEETTHEMWLAVMDGNNRAMKAEPYQITTKSGGTITVQKATMFDINKAIMRCLVKNLAMFGLGLYIYAGEDLPEEEAAIAALPICENCKQPVKDAVDTKGNPASAQDIADATMNKYGHVFCMECAHKVKEHMEKKKKAQAEAAARTNAAKELEKAINEEETA